MEKFYFEKEDLKKFNEGLLGDNEHDKEYWDKFLTYYGFSMDDDLLTKREKSLIALAVAHVLKCPYCIEAYTEGCLAEGCSSEEMMEAVQVAAAMSAGALLAQSIQMKSLAKKLEM